MAPAHHAMALDEVLAATQTNAEAGLDAADAQQRLARDGPNRLTARRGTPAWRRFLDQLVQPLVVVLVVAAVVSALLGDVADAIVISAVVGLNALIGFVQEHRAERAIAALDALVLTEATVIRNGEPHRVPSPRLVVGDLVVVASGDAVPADLRLVSVRDLQVDEASLTGESVPVSKQTATLPADTGLGDRTNMAFAGTVATFGRGRGVVVATGDDTETGRIAGMIARAAPLATPLTRRIAAFSRLLMWIILAVATVLFVVEALRGAALTKTFNAAIALAVAAIPEGLPAAVTVLLSVGVQAMARRRALVRKLPAVETLGSTTVICSDKTGTLTENEMTVTRVWTVGASYDVTGVGYRPEGEIRRAGEPVGEEVAAEPAAEPALLACLRVGGLCNDTRVVWAEDRMKVEGDPTEAALVVLAAKAGSAVALDAWQRIAEIPFESQRMYMATLHEGPTGRALLVKGSADVVLERCLDALGASGASVPFDLDVARAREEELGRAGLRVLCLAQRTVDAHDARLEPEDVRDLTLVGLVGMIDPPRESAKRSIAACHGAGILVKMITGDHAATASAIAAQLGLEGATDDAGRLEVVTGRALERLDPQALPALAQDVAVFARVAPEQKLRLVEALQRRGHVVAMTGDGVNDAPALEKADLGIAMGKSGTDVARGAADMVLTDDDFETIAVAVEEGRGVYDNLVKFIAWTLPTNGGEALVLLAAVMVGASLPVLPVQILWVNMTTALLLGIALVFEPKEPGLMDRPPRPVHAPLLDWRLGLRTLVVSVLLAGAAFGLFEWSRELGTPSIEASRTIAVNTIVVVEVAYLFACRSLTRPVWRIGVFSNPWVWLGAGVMLGAQLLFTYLPTMNRLFHSGPIGWIWWVYFSAAGLGVLVAVETYKVAARWWRARGGAGASG